VVRNPGLQQTWEIACSMSLMQSNIKYAFTPYSGTPGLEWEKFEERLLNEAARHTDDKGWSLADHFLGQDEGGPAGPAFPQQAAALASSQNAFRKRRKEAYGLLTRHLLDDDQITRMRNDTFQLGYESFINLRASCRMPVNQLRLREMDKEWDALDIINDIGINPFTIQQLCNKIRTLNGKRPAGHRKTQSQMSERLLECIFTSSKHFSEGAIIEYNAHQGERQHELRAPHPQAGDRDFNSIEEHYHPLWHAAVTSKLPLASTNVQHNHAKRQRQYAIQSTLGWLQLSAARAHLISSVRVQPKTMRSCHATDRQLRP
jgi:hypothetical protein